MRFDNCMRVGDMVRKRFGRVDPEDRDAIGIIIKKPSTPGGNPDFVIVQLPDGERLWRMSDMERLNE